MNRFKACYVLRELVPECRSLSLFSVSLSETLSKVSDVILISYWLGNSIIQNKPLLDNIFANNRTKYQYTIYSSTVAGSSSSKVALEVEAETFRKR